MPERIDEQGKKYKCTADDSAYATFELEGGVIAPFQLVLDRARPPRRPAYPSGDGTHGSAVCGLRECWTQHYGNTPRPTWNPDVAQPISFFDGWSKVPEQEAYDNAFKVQWNSSCVTSPSTNLSAGPCWMERRCPARPKSGSSPGRNAAGWMSRSSRSFRRGFRLGLKSPASCRAFECPLGFGKHDVEEPEIALVGGGAVQHHGQFAGVIIAHMEAFAARHLLARRDVVPAVRAMVDGVKDEAFVRGIGGEIRLPEERLGDRQSRPGNSARPARRGRCA